MPLSAFFFPYHFMCMWLDTCRDKLQVFLLLYACMPLSSVLLFFFPPFNGAKIKTCIGVLEGLSCWLLLCTTLVPHLHLTVFCKGFLLWNLSYLTRSQVRVFFCFCSWERGCMHSVDKYLRPHFYSCSFVVRCCWHVKQNRIKAQVDLQYDMFTCIGVLVRLTTLCTIR